MVESANLILGALLLLATNGSIERESLHLIEDYHETDKSQIWHQVQYQNQHIGSYSETRTTTATGSFEVLRSLTFKLIPNRTTHVKTSLTFSSTFPYELLNAVETTEVNINSDVHTSHRKFEPILSGASHSKMTYFDTIPFDPRLIQERSNLAIATVDFNKGRVKQSNWQLSHIEEESSVLHWVHDRTATLLRVSSAGLMLESNTKSKINLQLSNREAATAWQSNPVLLSNTEISIPADKPIENQSELSGLKLRVESEHGELGDWHALLNAENEIYIDRSKRTPVTEPKVLHAALAATHPAIRTYTQQINVPNDVSKSAQLLHIVNYLHNEIEYQETSVQRTVDETISLKSGDCTEIADLFDAVASEIGWITRKRHGFTYHPPSQSFRMHAWNEVELDGFWLPVDATLNQVPADASHVPFPPANTLALLQSASNLQFEVLEQRHSTQLN